MYIVVDGINSCNELKARFALRFGYFVSIGEMRGETISSIDCLT